MAKTPDDKSKSQTTSAESTIKTTLQNLLSLSSSSSAAAAAAAAASHKVNHGQLKTCVLQFAVSISQVILSPHLIAR